VFTVQPDIDTLKPELLVKRLEDNKAYLKELLPELDDTKNISSFSVELDYPEFLVQDVEVL